MPPDGDEYAPEVGTVHMATLTAGLAGAGGSLKRPPEKVSNLCGMYDGLGTDHNLDNLPPLQLPRLEPKTVALLAVLIWLATAARRW